MSLIVIVYIRVIIVVIYYNPSKKDIYSLLKR